MLLEGLRLDAQTAALRVFGVTVLEDW